MSKILAQLALNVDCVYSLPTIASLLALFLFGKEARPVTLGKGFFHASHAQLAGDCMLDKHMCTICPYLKFRGYGIARACIRLAEAGTPRVGARALRRKRYYAWSKSHLLQ